ncbi:MAG TPA: amidohydrolase family protein [Candidatus Acidoferrales bacterium]|nr:amidohydrolase family protein [Candidatus Acidoferrales bacterium]
MLAAFGIAFTAVLIAAGAATNGLTRTVMVTEGTNISATLSPDRKTIIMDLQEALWTLPIGGGTARRLTDPLLEPARPNWSPKGDAVAFQSFKGGTFHIWLMKPDGTGIRQLTDGHADDRDPCFSPDGTKVAFSSDRAFKGNYDIWVAEVASGKLTQWTSNPDDEFEPAWSVDGAEIAYVSGTGSIGTSLRSVNASGRERLVLSAPEGTHLNSPSWSPDGARIAYTQIAGNKAQLMVSGGRVGTVGDVFPFLATWLSANRIFYTGNGKLLTTTLSGGVTKNIPFQARFELTRPGYKRKTHDFDSAAIHAVKGLLSPALAPDGRRIIFEALNQLWLMEIGGKPVALTYDSFYKQSPAWSPDGGSIAYSSDKSGTADVYILDLATKAERRVTNLRDSAALDPVWSRDAQKLAFQKQDGATYTVDLASGEIHEAIKASFQPSKPSWSGKGNALSLAALRPYSKRFREGTSLILTADLATGQLTYTEPAPYKSITTRGVDGPVYSPDGSQMAFVMDGYLWVRPVDSNGIPIGEARPINEEMTDAPSWSGDGKRLLYLSNGKLRLIAADGKTPPVDVPLDLSWHRASSQKRTLIHAGHLWDGTGPNVRAEIDITIAGRRIQKIEPHRDESHRGVDAVVDASNLTVMPGLWETHNHGYGGLPGFGDRAGRIWLAYGFTDLQSQGDSAYGQMEIKESFGSGSRLGPRYFAAGEPIDGERGYYGSDHSVTNLKELQLELARAQALEYDNLKTYVRLPHDLQQAAAKFAHETLGIWTVSHYGMPGLSFGMDGMTHVSATSRWGYSYTRSYGGVSYQDIRQLFPAAGEFLISTPFSASALYAEDPQILDDPRIATLNTPWQQKAMMLARGRAVGSDRPVGPDRISTLESRKAEEETVASILHAGGTVVLGTDSPLPGLAILNHLGLRAEVKFGLQPWEALQTATLLAAKAFGYDKDLGSLEAGKLADLVLVAGEPLRDIKDVARIQQVMVDGRMYSIPELMAPFAAK